MDKREKISWKKDVGVSYEQERNIDGVDKSISLEIFPRKDHISTEFRVIIKDGEQKVVSPVLKGRIPPECSGYYILDEGKKFIFTASKGIIICKAPKQDEKASIEFIQLHENKEITELDYIEDKKTFIAFIDYGRDFVVFDENLEEIRNISPTMFGHEEGNTKQYDSEKGILTFSPSFLMYDASSNKVKQTINCVTGEQTIRIASIKGTPIDDNEDPLIVPIGEERSQETHNQVIKRTRKIILNNVKDKLSPSIPENIKYDFNYLDSRIDEVILLSATIEGLPLKYLLSSSRYSMIPTYAILDSDYTITPNKEKSPISYLSLFGELATEEEKKNGNIKRDGINITISTSVDDMGNIDSPCEVSVKFDTVESKSKDGFAGEEFSEVVSKHFDILKGLINVSLLINPYETNVTKENPKRKELE